MHHWGFMGGVRGVASCLLLFLNNNKKIQIHTKKKIQIHTNHIVQIHNKLVKKHVFLWDQAGCSILKFKLCIQSTQESSLTVVSECIHFTFHYLVKCKRIHNHHFSWLVHNLGSLIFHWNAFSGNVISKSGQKKVL